MKHKKLCTFLFSVLAGMMILSAAGCSETVVELSNYHGQNIDAETGRSEYNEELFYRNDWKRSAADPAILDDRAQSGYFYMYTTGFHIMRSKDLAFWEGVRRSPDYYSYNADPVERELLKDREWAPEVVFDKEEQLYYMTLTSQPVLNSPAYAFRSMTYVAISDKAEGPFRLVNFVEDDGVHPYVGDENRRDYSDSKYASYQNDWWLDYCVLDPLEEIAASEKFGLPYAKQAAPFGSGEYIGNLDTHLFVDPVTNKKYMYFVREADFKNYIWGVEMENWFTPVWETAQALVYPCVYTLEDAVNLINDRPFEQVSYEIIGNHINEGPQMTYHKDKYYLTFSVNYFDNGNYSVVQAVSDSPLGPFRKLTESENGLLLSGNDGSEELVGTGHHGFVEVDGKLYMVYHRLRDRTNKDRGHSVNEIKWVTIEDIDGNQLDVMYANGPNATVMPKFDFCSEYTNIAGQKGTAIELEKGKLEEGSDLSALNDGLLSAWKNNTEFNEKYIKETTITETSTFKISFNSVKTVRAVMVYDSRFDEKVFYKIPEIKLTCVENGKTVKKVIRNLELTEDQYVKEDYMGTLLYIYHSANIYAEFAEQKVTEIEITVEVPENQDAAGISEIIVLGK